MPNSAPPREAVSVLTQNFLVDVPCSLSVDVPSAHVRLRPESASEQVNAEISMTGCPPDEAEELSERMGLEAYKRKNTVSVITNSNRSGAEWWRWIRTFDAQLHVDLRLPSRLETTIRASGGAVDLANLQGHFDVQIMGGACQVKNVGGTLDVRAESSDVSIQDFSGEEVLARVDVGSLSLENVEADSVTVRGVAAPLTLTSVTGHAQVTAKSAPVELQSVPGPCQAHVDGGALTYDGTPTDEVELVVVGTTLDAYLPASHGADLHASGPRLSLADEFPFDGERTPTEIEGTLNGGGPSLTLTASGGSVNCQPS